MIDTGQATDTAADRRALFGRDARCTAGGTSGGVPELTSVMMRLSRQLTLTRHRLFAGSSEALPLQLMFLMHKMGPARSGEYAAALSADPSTVSRQVAHLVRAGLARREADQHDGRATHVVLTDQGRTALDRLRAVIDEVFAGLVADWSERDRDELVRLTHRYVEAFDERGATLVDRVSAEIARLGTEPTGGSPSRGPDSRGPDGASTDSTTTDSATTESAISDSDTETRTTTRETS